MIGKLKSVIEKGLFCPYPRTAEVLKASLRLLFISKRWIGSFLHEMNGSIIEYEILGWDTNFANAACFCEIFLSNLWFCKFFSYGPIQTCLWFWGLESFLVSFVTASHRQTEKLAVIVSRSIKYSSFDWVLIQTPPPLPHRSVFLLEHIKCNQWFIWMSVLFYWNLTKNQNLSQCSRTVKFMWEVSWVF